ncbi:MAG: RNA polymerase sigma-70 factor [Proteiniphilum sp.]|uniref:RNA polymerase sigma-70 factor n=1 Tax=Proteiniphilum sp. TaxID=1926877 RepID=UPI00092A29EB|nr:RNA polymerase sigma-70 factor [Proteiniphilum sp.]MEA5129899.1 RNA polymerase sigma-70 factor [Proteiniphilum sp.]OJV79817.1 MAG: RNA polymerase sigma-70 factor [Bacteroidia bacterium 44-10]
MNTESRRKQFEEIFIQYFPKARTFAAILLKSEQEAEDIAQDIFVKLWEQPNLWEENLVRNYLYTMVKNHVFNRIKRKNIESNYINSQINLSSPEDMTEFKDPLNEVYLEEMQLLLKLSLEQMPDKRRQVFEMSRFEHLSNNDIAEKMDLSVRTVEQHIYLALKDLKKLFFIAFFFIKF